MRFDDVFCSEFINKLHERFEIYISNRVLGQSLCKIIEDEIFIGNDKENIKKVFKNLDIRLSDDEVVSFLEANCYFVGLPKMFIAGRQLNESGKLCVAALSFFHGQCDDPDYPHSSIDEQIDEFISSKLSVEFLSTASQWCLESLVKDYKKEYALI